MPYYRFNRSRLKTAYQPIVVAESPIVLVSLVLCNTDTSNRTFSIQHVPADEVESDEHDLFFDTQIRSKITQIIETPIFMGAGDQIIAKASIADKVAMTVYALDYDSFLQAPRFG